MSSKPATARGRATRQSLLDAAEEVFGQSSYARAGVTDVTRRAGVAQGTFYVYFDSKEEIILELVRQLGSQLRGTLREAIADAPDRIAAEEIGLRAFFRFLREHRNLYRIVRQAEFIDEETYRTYYQRFAEGYIEGLQAAVGRGEVADIDPEAVTWALMGIADFLGMRWVLWEGREPPEEVLDAVMAFVRRGLAPRDRD